MKRVGKRFQHPFRGTSKKLQILAIEQIFVAVLRMAVALLKAGVLTVSRHAARCRGQTEMHKGFNGLFAKQKEEEMKVIGQIVSTLIVTSTLLSVAAQS